MAERGVRWTRSADAIVVQWYKSHGWERVHKELAAAGEIERSEGAIYTRAHYLGVTGRREERKQTKPTHCGQAVRPEAVAAGFEMAIEDARTGALGGIDEFRTIMGQAEQTLKRIARDVADLDTFTQRAQAFVAKYGRGPGT